MEEFFPNRNISVPTSKSVSQKTLSAPASVPLGTAAWRTEGLRRYRSGNFLLGRADDMTVGQDDESHVAVICKTRGGKGVSVIIPNLCTWQGSAVVIDPKGENAMVTARRRGNGSAYCHGIQQKVHILDPFEEIENTQDSLSDLKAAFNPIDLVDPRREDSVNEAGRIADALIFSERTTEPFWDDAARGLLTGLILHVSSSWDFLPDERNLITVHRLVMEGDASARKVALQEGKAKDVPSAFELLAKSMKRNPAFNGNVAQTGAMLEDMENSAKMRLGVLMVLRTNLDFIKAPGMQRCLSRSDFALSDLKTDPKGVSLYLTLPSRLMEPHFRWLRMMTTLMIGEMERVRHQPKCGHRVLMVLDEFSALGRLKVIENAAAQIAGFGVKLMFVAQTLPQLKETYKDNWETLLANCGTKLFFGNDDHFTRDYISKLVGDCEVVRRVSSFSETKGKSSSTSQSVTFGTSRSQSFGSSFGGTGSRGSNSSSSFGSSSSFSSSVTNGESHSQTSGFLESVHKRALMTPDEVGRLFGDDANPRILALTSGRQPLMLKRIVYHTEGWLRGFFDANYNYALPPTLKALKDIKTYEDLERCAQVLAASAAAAEEKAKAEANERYREGMEAIRKERKECDDRFKRKIWAYGSTVCALTILWLVSWLLEILGDFIQSHQFFS